MTEDEKLELKAQELFEESRDRMAAWSEETYEHFAGLRWENVHPKTREGYIELAKISLNRKES